MINSGVKFWGGVFVHKKLISFAYVMTFLYQVIFSFALPFGLFWLAGYLLQTKMDCGKWALVLGIVLGALLGVYSMFHYIITAVDWASKEDRRQSPGKNEENKK